MSSVNNDTHPDLTVEISNTIPGRPVPGTGHIAYLVHIYPQGPALGMRFTLSGASILVGRDTTCDACINDLSVSRRHALLQPDEDGYSVIDLHSTNGTSVNKVPVTQCRLRDGDDLRFGNCIYRFLASSNVEAQYHEELYRLTVSDALTHIPNRRYLLQCLERELARSARYHRPLGLVLLDIDHFKTINDDMGHLAGDFTLRELAICVEGTVRKDGLFARLGGEEFAVLLPEATLAVGVQVADRIRRQVEKHRFEYQGRPYSITVSLGVAATEGHDSLSCEELLQKADMSLYQAKKLGRNRVVPEPVAATTTVLDQVVSRA
jgi:diguanylate cyclase (GGDEF)-like protein